MRKGSCDVTPRPSMFCFDLDDTLISEAAYVESGLTAVGPHVDALAKCAAGESARWLVEQWRATKSSTLFQQLLQRHGLDDTHVAALVTVYREHTPTIALRQGALAALEALVARGDRLSLISDGYLQTQQLKWRALALTLPFNPVVFTDAHGRDRWKPHPAAFELVMKSAPDIEAQRFFYVADNVDKDFIAPNALGWTTVSIVHEDNVRPKKRASDSDAAAKVEIQRFDQLLTL